MDKNKDEAKQYGCRQYRCMTDGCEWNDLSFFVWPTKVGLTPFVAWPVLTCECGNEPVRVLE